MPKWFLYTTGWGISSGAAGAVIPMKVAINAGAPFLCEYLTLSIMQGAVGAEAPVTDFYGTILIELGGSADPLMNEAAPISAFNGSGQLPYWLKPAREIPGNTTIRCTVTVAIATRTLCNLTLHGAKLGD